MDQLHAVEIRFVAKFLLRKVNFGLCFHWIFNRIGSSPWKSMNNHSFSPPFWQASPSTYEEQYLPLKVLPNKKLFHVIMVWRQGHDFIMVIFFHTTAFRISHHSENAWNAKVMQLAQTRAMFHMSAQARQCTNFCTRWPFAQITAQIRQALHKFPHKLAGPCTNFYTSWQDFWTMTTACQSAILPL